MSLIKPKSKTKRQVVRLNLDENILKSIQDYCAWANIDRLEDFIEGAAEFVMRRDKEWAKVSGLKKAQCLD